MQVTVLSTGGTIASTGDDDKTPTKAGEELIDAVPGLDGLASFTVERVASVSGFDVTWERAAALRGAARDAVDGGADGVVVTHGTDTMAESAYLLDLTTDLDVPVAFTGAQRPFDQVGTDGPPNLLAAVRTVTHERVDDGTFLVFDDEIHAARDVVKRHTSALSTFDSPERGPVAEFTPEGLRLFREPRSYSGAAPDVGEIDAEIPVLTSGLGMGGDVLRRVVGDMDDPAVEGVVVAGTGLGNTTGALAGAIAEAREAGLPVVIASRCHEGATAPLYGGDGGATTLDELGVFWAGDLPAWKARIKLAVALARGDDGEDSDGVDAAFFEAGLREPGW